jgi:hypothetical protein
LSRTIKVLLDLITVWFLRGYQTKPIYVFGGMGFGLLGVSGLLSAFVLWQKFFEGVWVHRNPLFMIVILLAVVGVQFIVLGLLAELVIRTYFEIGNQRPYSIARKIGFDSEAGGKGVGLKTANSSPADIACAE